MGPYPTNVLTSPSFLQSTGRQINLPIPSGCSVLSTLPNCVNVLLENQLDGFIINPRIAICFSGPINTGTLQTAIAFSPVGAFSTSIGINQGGYLLHSGSPYRLWSDVSGAAAVTEHLIMDL